MQNVKNKPRSLEKITNISNANDYRKEASLERGQPRYFLMSFNMLEPQTAECKTTTTTTTTTTNLISIIRPNLGGNYSVV